MHRNMGRGGKNKATKFPLTPQAPDPGNSIINAQMDIIDAIKIRKKKKRKEKKKKARAIQHLVI